MYIKFHQLDVYKTKHNYITLNCKFVDKCKKILLFACFCFLGLC